MLYAASDIIAAQHPELVDKIDRIDKYLAKLKSNYFFLASASDFVGIKNEELDRILALYIGQDTVSDETILTCPIHTNNVVEQQRDGTYWCSIDEMNYEEEDCHSRTRYHLMQQPDTTKLKIPDSDIAQKETEVNEFDVFLAHNSDDKPTVVEIANKLKDQGIKPWLDKEQIPPGRWFQDVIQEAIPKVKSAAIFFGPSGLGKWQEVELRSFISECVNRNIPVIPVLLPGVNTLPRNLVFLKELSWVKFESTIDEIDPLENLIWGIRGKKA